jgi:peroxiredoxin
MNDMTEPHRPVTLTGALILALGAMAIFSVAGKPGVAAQQPGAAPAPDVTTLGPQVGQRVPDFTLKDQRGQTRTLASLMGPNGLVLAFNRSADWCPYCKTQLIEMQGRVETLRRSGLGLAAITYDPVPILADFAARRGITYPLLSDAGSATIKAYGILNTTVPETNALHGYPFPGTFVLNRNGVVTSRFFEPTYQERDTVTSILVRLGQNVDVPAVKTSAPHLDITSYLTDQVAAPGTRFSIVLDLVPGPRVHVYAPGVTGYRPIALVVRAQPGVVVRDAHFPTPETYVFEPLNERVLVYQRPFRIVQDVMLDPSREAAATLRDLKTLTLQATLDYQACDDKVCFNPQSVPLTWTIAVRSLDTERAARP